ncbi:MAG: hypothetical protein IKQ01_08230 [Bacteroidales bacterium]|nr:hypothetical protein [Bacteroidales bacterium]
MILFVFEGTRREPDIFRTLEYLFFPKGQTIVCSFGNNIYELYRQLKALDGGGDIVSILREKYNDNPENPFSPETKSSDFSEIFLFFDYDFQNSNLSLEQMNQQISEMLDLFNDETDNGLLYINYPMLEAIRYTKTLPDPHYAEYTVSRIDCHEKGFKDLAEQFTDYHSFDFIVLDFRRTPAEIKVSTTKRNWALLETQNVIKANKLCNGELTIPVDKDAISQRRIFEAQLSQFIIPKDEVSILSAFPLFNFNYFKH